VRNANPNDVIQALQEQKPGTSSGKQTAEVIPLRYANSSNILPALQDMVAANSRTSGGKEIAGHAIVLPSSAPAAAEPSITVDSSGNLVVSGDQSTVEQLRRTVARLDTPTRQVLIETNALVGFADTSLGLDWKSAAQRQNGNQSDSHGAAVAGII